MYLRPTAQTLQEPTPSAACAPGAMTVHPHGLQHATVLSRRRIWISDGQLVRALCEVHRRGAPQGDLPRGGFLQRRRQRKLQQIRPRPGLGYGA